MPCRTICAQPRYRHDAVSEVIRLHPIAAYGTVRFAIPKPSLRPQKHVFDGEHFWEIGKLGYPLKKVLADFSACHLALEKMYRVQENPYHHFFILKPVRNR